MQVKLFPNFTRHHLITHTNISNRVGYNLNILGGLFEIA